MSLGFAIVDAHQHFWDPTRNYHPWLCDEPPIAFRYGDYRSLRRPYLPPQYRADAAPYEVSHSVYIETEWDPRDPVGEMRYVQTLRAEHGLPSVAIGAAWLDRSDAAALLEQEAALPFVRGVRHKPRAHRAPGSSEPGGTASRPWACTSSCRRPGGTCTKRRAWPPTSRARRSCSTTPGCRPTAAPRGSLLGGVRWPCWRRALTWP
jgi:hypothetical protein